MTEFRLSVTYAAGHTHEFAPAGGTLSGDQLMVAASAFLGDLAALEGRGITRLVAEVWPPDLADVAGAAVRAIESLAGLVDERLEGMYEEEVGRARKAAAQLAAAEQRYSNTDDGMGTKPSRWGAG